MYNKYWMQNDTLIGYLNLKEFFFHYINFLQEPSFQMISGAKNSFYPEGTRG